MNIEQLYYWELEYTDGTKWDRRKNVYYKKTPKHIDQQNPPKQVFKVKFIPLRKDLPELECNIPPNFRPVCYWFNIINDKGQIINIQMFIGCQNKKKKFYKIYDVKEKTETYVREDIGDTRKFIQRNTRNL